MKIAIPTSDGIHISDHLANATGYLVFSVEFGEIVEEELRIIGGKVNNGMNEPFLSIQHDCSALIIHSKNNKRISVPQLKDIEVVQTTELVITNIVMSYLNIALLQESNTTCCP